MEKKSLLMNGRPAIFAGIAGSLLLLFMSWDKNMAPAAWLIPILLIYSFRNQARWYTTLPAAVLCVAMKTMAMHCGWDIELTMEIVFGILVTAPLLTALYLDRYFYRKTNPLVSTLIFPAAYTALDFLLSFTPVGMTFSLPYTQSRQLVMIQAASLFGSWFIGFMAAWFGSVLNTVLSQAFEGKRVWKLLAAYTSILAVLLACGSVKQVFARPEGDTVRIGSISVTHPEDFWSITDAGTPREGSGEKKKIMAGIGEELFLQSQKAADYGARVIFWSEGNYVMYEDQYDAFMEKARSFARENGVYFMPAILVLHYDSHKNDNMAVMIAPDGKVAFEYEKTNSWYPTDSDGIIKKTDTPYGRIGSVICFDMDFPGFIRQAADVDIMLVPAYDTKKISPFHTEAALLRGVEYGFSVIRQCNAGASMAADYNGYILAYQNYFTTKERCMVSDVPTKGITTLYQLTGEWFAWACLAGLGALILWGMLFRQSIAAGRRHTG
jgi:apolipoprotein N-acyltransferase